MIDFRKVYEPEEETHLIDENGQATPELLRGLTEWVKDVKEPLTLELLKQGITKVGRQLGKSFLPKLQLRHYQEEVLRQLQQSAGSVIPINGINPDGEPGSFEYEFVGFDPAPGPDHATIHVTWTSDRTAEQPTHPAMAPSQRWIQAEELRAREGHEAATHILAQLDENARQEIAQMTRDALRSGWVERYEFLRPINIIPPELRDMTNSQLGEPHIPANANPGS